MPAVIVILDTERDKVRASDDNALGEIPVHVRRICNVPQHQVPRRVFEMSRRRKPLRCLTVVEELDRAEESSLSGFPPFPTHECGPFPGLFFVADEGPFEMVEYVEQDLAREGLDRGHDLMRWEGEALAQVFPAS